MKRWMTLVAGLALGLGSTAQAAQRGAALPCIPTGDAEALFVYVMPDLVRELGTRCTAALPANAFLKTRAQAWSARYADAGNATWPAARRALAQIVGPDNLQFLDSQFARPMVGALAGPLIASKIDVGDCPVLDRAMGLIEPLPPRNTAGLLVLFAQLAARDPERSQGLNICPLPR